MTGPFLDNMGIDMLQGGGKLFAGLERPSHRSGTFRPARSRRRRAEILLHYEADLDRGGISVLDIRPLLWRDGWPVAGDNFVAGTYQIESARTGTALELAVQGLPVGGFRGSGGRGGPAGRGAGGGRGESAAARTHPGAGRRSGRARTGRPAPSMCACRRYMLQAQQKWAIAPVANAGGYPGSPYFKITIAGTDRALAATGDGELVAIPAFTGGPEQLWRIDQLTDGTYRVMPKAVPNAKEPLALSAAGSSKPTLDRFKADERSAALAAQDAVSVDEASHEQTLAALTPALVVLAVVAGLSSLPGPQDATARAPGADARASQDADQGDRRCRVPAALARARAHPRDGTAHRQRRSGRGQDRVLPDQLNVVPRDGDTVTAGDAQLTWHAVDTTKYNVNLFHFAYALGKPTSNVLLLGRHPRQRAAGYAGRPPRHRLERRLGLVGQRRGSHQPLQRPAGGD